MSTPDQKRKFAPRYCTAMQCRVSRKYLRELIESVELAIDAIDAEMEKPSSLQRGKNIAKITNGLELQKDLAKRYGFIPKSKRS